MGYAFTNQGNVETKLEYLFDMYDVDKNGFLEKLEVHEVLTAMLSLLNSELDENARKRLAEECFEKLDTSKAGLLCRGEQKLRCYF